MPRRMMRKKALSAEEIHAKSIKRESFDSLARGLEWKPPNATQRAEHDELANRSLLRKAKKMAKEGKKVTPQNLAANLQTHELVYLCSARAPSNEYQRAMYDELVKRGVLKKK